MSRCPYCKRAANPLRFVTYSRWSPYRCGKCGKKSKLSIWGITIIASLGAGLAAPLYPMWPTGIAWLCAVLVGIILAMWLCLKLHPIAPIEDSEQDECTVPVKPAPSASSTVR
jgi:hypothetical protein